MFKLIFNYDKKITISCNNFNKSHELNGLYIIYYDINIIITEIIDYTLSNEILNNKFLVIYGNSKNIKILLDRYGSSAITSEAVENFIIANKVPIVLIIFFISDPNFICHFFKSCSTYSSF